MIGAGETSRNDKLRVAWERLGNTRAGRANTAKRAPNMLTHHRYVCVHVCTSSIQCEFQTNTHQSKCNNEFNQQRDGAAETSRNDKLRVAWEGLGNTRDRRTNTAKRAPTMLMHHHHVRVHVCTVSMLVEFSNQPVPVPLKQQVETPT